MSRNLNRLLSTYNKNFLSKRLGLNLPNQFLRLQSQEAKQPPKKATITWKSVGVLAVFGAGSLAFMYYVKNEKDVALMRERKRQLGKAQIGGKWDLMDCNGKTRTSEEFLGKWLLIYFGFTHCPDVCPDELEKMALVVDEIDKSPESPGIQPIFITVDPARDSKEVVEKYVKEFSPKLLGLTGTLDQINRVCKAFRVYFSAGPRDEDNDYIVDHTIIMYLVNPDGEFVDYYGQSRDKNQVTASILVNMAKWDQLHKKSWFSKD